jgi:ATP-binding cassette subfamily G (WHITE) protein 2 (SNQ2)
VSPAIGNSEITCSAVEYVTLNPPSGQTCGSYLQPFISTVGGYLQNSDATTACQFCSTRTTDEFLGTRFNITYASRWWHLGVFAAYIVFNVRTLCLWLSSAGLELIAPRRSSRYSL